MLRLSFARPVSVLRFLLKVFRMKQFFQIPDKYKFICLTPIGVPEEWPDMPRKKNLENLVVFEDF